MKLSKRLKAICDLVPEGSNIIDIGTDHGYVPIYLNLVKNCKCLATDISLKSLEKAKNNSERIKTNISFCLTDGLNNIKLDNQILIISGMGTTTILKILDMSLNNDLIISTNNDVLTLKEKLLLKGYYIYKEVLVEEHKKYKIIYFKKHSN